MSMDTKGIFLDNYPAYDDLVGWLRIYQSDFMYGKTMDKAADLIESQAREIEELKQALSEIGVTPNEARAGAARSKAKCAEIKELRAALSSLVGVTAIYAIRYDDDELDEALTRCKEALKCTQ